LSSEIPLFRVLNAVVTFGNVFGSENPVDHVTILNENERLTCILDDAIFQIPPSYRNRGSEFRRQFTFEDEDELMQFAIQQSLVESGSENDEVKQLLKFSFL
jgi:ankyrin repeat domain-containing protein 13